MTLPEMSGAEFMAKLKTVPAWGKIKIVVVSGVDELKRRAREIGADGFIRKPFELSTFYDELEKQLS